ncbi:MAG TPA: hypothetical protein VFJ43_06120 [Bacteroidia bacterium]|nr:hypothetical protein [Bacteroidia bacterium]
MHNGKLIAQKYEGEAPWIVRKMSGLVGSSGVRSSDCMIIIILSFRIPACVQAEHHVEFADTFFFHPAKNRTLWKPEFHGFKIHEDRICCEGKNSW